MSEALLKQHILELSKADEFEEAVKEWTWVGVTYDPDWNHCPCSQAIKEVCHIKNKYNGNTTHVGNNCINKFLGIETGNIFSLLKRLVENNDWVIPNALIKYAKDFGYIYPSEVAFLESLNTPRNRKRVLTEKQRNWRNKIVWRILNKVKPQT